MAFAPQQPSPLVRTTSPFEHPRPAPSAPGKTAQLWDEYEKRAIENARRREGNKVASPPQRTSALSIPHATSSSITSARSSFDFDFRNRQTTLSSEAVATCKICNQSITLRSGICEPCKKTVILPSPSCTSTPPLSPTARKFATSDLQLLYKKLSLEQEGVYPKSTSPKRRSFCPVPAQLLDPPVRLSSLKPLVTHGDINDPSRCRKTSLTGPNEPFLRLKISQATYSNAPSYPSTPTYPPTTPPSTSHSRASTRPSSLANNVSPMSPAVHIPTHPYTRQGSVTPSELSALYPYTSPSITTTTTTTATTSTGITAPDRPSLNTSATGYTLQRATSAWDDWDSDSDSEKAGFVGYLKKASKSRKNERERSDSKTSFQSAGDARDEVERGVELKEDDEYNVDAAARSGEVGDACAWRAKARGKEKGKAKEKGESRKKRSRGFVRAISCGGCSDD